MGKTIASRLLKPLPTNLLLYHNSILRVVETPKSIELDTGLKELVRTASSQTGVMVETFRQVTEEMPKIKMSFPGLSQEIIEILLGRIFADADGVATFYGRNRVLVDSVTGAEAGVDGYGLAADNPNAIASAFGPDGHTIALTRQPYATFNPATDDSFAQGANGAMKFSDNLTGYQKSWRVPQTLDGVRKLSSTDVGQVGIVLTFIDSSNYVMRLQANAGQFVLDGSQVAFGSDQVNTTYAVAYDGSQCLPYDMVWTGQIVKC